MNINEINDLRFRQPLGSLTGDPERAAQPRQALDASRTDSAAAARPWIEATVMVAFGGVIGGRRRPRIFGHAPWAPQRWQSGDRDRLRVRRRNRRRDLCRRSSWIGCSVRLPMHLLFFGLRRGTRAHAGRVVYGTPPSRLIRRGLLVQTDPRGTAAPRLLISRIASVACVWLQTGGADRQPSPPPAQQLRQGAGWGSPARASTGRPGWSPVRDSTSEPARPWRGKDLARPAP